MEDCDGSGSIPDHAFHFEIKHGATNGILETMRLKPGHVFDVGQLKIVVHPIVCHAGNFNVTYIFESCQHAFVI